MKAIKVFEKFSEDSDPIHDMGIGLKECFKRLTKGSIIRFKKDLILDNGAEGKLFPKNSYLKILYITHENEEIDMLYSYYLNKKDLETDTYRERNRSWIITYPFFAEYFDVEKLKESINEKFTDQSDPIHDMQIGIILQLKHIENMIVDLLEAKSKEEIMQFDVENNLKVDGTYTIDAIMDGFGIDDIFELHFVYNLRTNVIKMDVFSADGTNLRKCDFTIKARSLEQFEKKIERGNFWNIYFAKDKRLSKREAENLGIS